MNYQFYQWFKSCRFLLLWKSFMAFCNYVFGFAVFINWCVWDVWKSAAVRWKNDFPAVSAVLTCAGNKAYLVVTVFSFCFVEIRNAAFESVLTWCRYLVWFVSASVCESDGKSAVSRLPGSFEKIKYLTLWKSYISAGCAAFWSFSVSRAFTFTGSIWAFTVRRSIFFFLQLKIIKISEICTAVFFALVWLLLSFLVCLPLLNSKAAHVPKN